MPSSITIAGVELTRYVQSTFKIKGGGKTIWVDPIMVDTEQIGSDKADMILVTHEHFDHFNVDSINAASKEATILVCSNGGIINQIRGNVKAAAQVMKEGDTSDVAGIPVKATAGYNDYHPRNQGYNSFNVGFTFTLGGKIIFHAGDTDLIDEFGVLGPVDLALVPIGGTYTMDEADAAKGSNQLIKPQIAIPMHYGYATGGDPDKFKELVGNAATVHILDPVFDVRA